MRMMRLTTDLVFPLHCPVCDELAPPGRAICPECERFMRPLPGPRCMKCGKKVAEEEEYCGDCIRITHRFDRGRALYEYDCVAASIYRMKYGGRREYAAYFGREMAEKMGDFVRQVSPDALIPVPLHAKRFRQRGYNQAALLARAMGREIGVPVREDLVLRVKNTKPLKRQNPTERQNNLKKAFIINQNDVKLKLKSTIIIDDIYTTGSTVDAVAGVLKDWGVERVGVITLACGAGV